MRLGRTLMDENVGGVFLEGGHSKPPLFSYQLPMRLGRTLMDENVGGIFWRAAPPNLPFFHIRAPGTITIIHHQAPKCDVEVRVSHSAPPTVPAATVPASRYARSAC